MIFFQSSSVLASTHQVVLSHLGPVLLLLLLLGLPHQAPVPVRLRPLSPRGLAGDLPGHPGGGGGGGVVEGIVEIRLRVGRSGFGVRRGEY